ncbi:MAG: hypothetical protein HC919_15560 [Oscillatoriales cyanobacterium SM2_2_1]|nr:hypothetical protein [Oscillatoriales cyanobacterium SM2_2_1]
MENANVRISLVLSPCPHATGREVSIARSYPEIDRVQAPEHFWDFLLWGKTAEGWDWHPKGVVLFLGGDQFFTVAIARRLHYASVVYAEWDTRWHPWIDRFGARNAQVAATMPAKFQAKATVIGDLMADVAEEPETERSHLLATLTSNPTPRHPTSSDSSPAPNPPKLAQGTPLCLAIAQHLHFQTNTNIVLTPSSPSPLPPPQTSPPLPALQIAIATPSPANSAIPLPSS